jgi:hypothetical protein
MAMVDPRIRGVALVALILEVFSTAMIPILPSEKRIYAYFGSTAIFLAVLVGMVILARGIPQGHDAPKFGWMVEKLKDLLITGRFLPRLIVAISRSGLPVAGSLAEKLGDEQIVPVITLSPSQGGSGFNNPFNHISLKRMDFIGTPSEPIKVLIVDDICRSGRTLDDAKGFIMQHLDPSEFVVKTAVLSFYRSHKRANPPSFFVDRPDQPIRDFSGDLEAWTG